MDIGKSITFVHDKGSNLEKARLDCILHGTRPAENVLQDFLPLQNADGGFPFGMLKGNLSTVNETTVALWWMEELDLFTSPSANQTFQYLIDIQHPDGSWDEDPRLAQYDLPPWIQLGDVKTQVYLSAYATYWLAVAGYMKQPAFRKAIHYLIRNQDKDGKFYGYLHTTWIATAVFLRAGDRYADIARLGMQALSGKKLSEMADSQIAWALDCLSAGGLLKSHPFIERCLWELFHRQKPDGSWASEDGETFAVGATIQVLKVFKRYNLFPGGWGG